MSSASTSNRVRGKDDFPQILTDEEREAAIKRARARALKQFDEREHLRAEIETRWHLGEIVRILKARWPDTRTGQNELTQKMNGHFRILSKCLPDLKTVEVRTEDMLDPDAAPQQIYVVASPTATRALRTVNPQGGHVIDAAPDPIEELLM